MENHNINNEELAEAMMIEEEQINTDREIPYRLALLSIQNFTQSSSRVIRAFARFFGPHSRAAIRRAKSVIRTMNNPATNFITPELRQQTEGIIRELDNVPTIMTQAQIIAKRRIRAMRRGNVAQQGGAAPRYELVTPTRFHSTRDRPPTPRFRRSARIRDMQRRRQQQQ